LISTSEFQFESRTSRGRACFKPENQIGRKIVRHSYKLGLTACVLFVAASTAASAADLGKGNNAVNAVITQSTCGTLSPTLKKGTSILSNILYGGPGTKVMLASAGTMATGKPGSANTTVCVARTATPKAGLNGATVALTCYDDTLSGPAKSPQAKLEVKFKIGGSHAALVNQINTVISLFVPATSPKPLCTYTDDGTAVAE
jgi:hypothetical protein